MFRYHFLMHFVILIWGFTGVLGKLIDLSPEIIVWYRVLIAVVSLFLFFIIFKIPVILPSGKIAWQLALIGIVTALHWVTFFKSIELSTASLGVLCLSTATFHVTWLEPLLTKRRFSWTECFLGLLIIYGIYFISSDFNYQQYIALGYGLLSAFFSALFSVANAHFARTMRSIHITFYEMLAGIPFLTIILILQGQFTTDTLRMQLSDFWWLLFLGIICTSCAFVWMLNVVRKLGVFTTSLNINLEPVYAILLAIVLLNEHQILGRTFYIGALLIVIIVMVNTILKAKNKKHSGKI